MYSNCRFWIVLAFASVVTAHYTRKMTSEFEQGFIRAIEKWKNGDGGSLPIALPSLRPLEVEPASINYDGYTTALSGIKVYGLENMNIEKFSASQSDFTVSLLFNVPLLQVVADNYQLTGAAFFGFIRIDDSGEFQTDVRNLRVAAVMSFSASGSDTVITNMNFDYSVGSVKAYLGGSTRMVNNGFNDKLYDLLVYRKNRVINRVKRIIEEKSRELLRGHLPAELAHIISKV